MIWIRCSCLRYTMLCKNIKHYINPMMLDLWDTLEILSVHSFRKPQVLSYKLRMYFCLELETCRVNNYRWKYKSNKTSLLSNMEEVWNSTCLTTGCVVMHSQILDCPSTESQRLREAGLGGCISVTKPLLRVPNKKKKLARAKEDRKWCVEDRCKALWMDESMKFPCKNRASL